MKEELSEIWSVPFCFYSLAPIATTTTTTFILLCYVIIDFVVNGPETRKKRLCLAAAANNRGQNTHIRRHTLKRSEGQLSPNVLSV